MCALATDSGAALQRGEESANFAPHFGPAGKPAPVGADQADELVTFIDREPNNTPRRQSLGCARRG